MGKDIIKSDLDANPLLGMDIIFNPKSVAVIGASSMFGKWGQRVLVNIVSGGFKGRVYPVNPKEERLCGLPVYKNIQDIPEAVELAFICTPAKTVPSILETCAESGVKGIVAITSGFRETDAAGKRLEDQIVSICRNTGLILIGPNTMGIICAYASLYGMGATSKPKEGSVAFISQSGNLGNQLIHWAEEQGVGISLFVGSGNEAMLNIVDYLEYLEKDPHTSIILYYVENIENGRRFLEAAKRVNRIKPVIILKGGRTQAGKVASASHTGSMGGEMNTFMGACKQAGLLQAAVPSELLELSAGFSSLPLPKGNRIGIVTLGGGWGVVTADECNEKGLVIPSLPDRIINKIDGYLPPFWSKGNPVDLVGTEDRDVPLLAVEELLKWDGIDAVISLGIDGINEAVRVMIDTTLQSDPSASPEFMDKVESFNLEYEKRYIHRIVELMEIYEKPVIGVSLVATKETVRSVPGKRYNGVFFQSPESAVNVLASMVSYQQFIAKF
jgi:acyl-CoA synthetase (NDP forming)